MRSNEYTRFMDSGQPVPVFVKETLPYTSTPEITIFLQKTKNYFELSIIALDVGGLIVLSNVRAEFLTLIIANVQCVFRTFTVLVIRTSLLSIIYYYCCTFFATFILIVGHSFSKYILLLLFVQVFPTYPKNECHFPYQRSLILEQTKW